MRHQHILGLNGNSQENEFAISDGQTDEHRRCYTSMPLWGHASGECRSTHPYSYTSIFPQVI